MPYSYLFSVRSLGDSARPFIETAAFAFPLLPFESFSIPSLLLEDFSCAQGKISCGLRERVLGLPWWRSG